MSADGSSNAVLAARLKLTMQTIGKWQRRFVNKPTRRSAGRTANPYVTSLLPGIALTCVLTAVAYSHDEHTFKRTLSPSGSIGGFEARFIDVKGVRTRYYEVGKGEIVFLIHGSIPAGTSSANTWVPVFAPLSRRMRVIAPDRLGHGMTANPRGLTTIQAEIEHLYNLIQIIRPDRLHIIGQGIGAYIAVRFAMEHPKLIKTLVIVDTAALSPLSGESQKQLASASTEKDVQEQFRASVESLSFSKDHVTDEFVEAAMHMAGLPSGRKTEERMKRGGAASFEDSLERQQSETLQWIKEGKLQTPTLLYWAKNDPAAIMTVGVALFEMIAEKNARTRMLIANNVGHFHYRERPEEFSRSVINFLSGWN